LLFGAAMKNVALALGVVVLSSMSIAASDGLSVALEIDEPELGGQVQVGLHLVGAHGCASASEHREKVTYKVTVCRSDEQLSDKEAVLKLDIERVVQKEKNADVRKFRVESRVALGKKVTVGRWATGDEKGMELRVTAR
jgi:hypothetical protein